ncbi:uncharacterized protein LOC130725700 [Lotus japonicus]|uniref:uncharacterized protein LOC130725700 n=1 Tax=Lotus japonicus TaxID=34305 RepID=UPI00258FF269|nr:uncharacterized protein LOC130725700 [Lotus japonicus]
MGQNSGNFPANLPKLDGKNWRNWCVQMKAIMGYQELTEIVEEGFSALPEGATEAQQAAHKAMKKLDCKALFLLHQCVDAAHFEKISAATNARDAWRILEKANDGADQLKKVKLQTLRRQYELLQMEANERIADYFTRILSLTNLMKGFGETITDLSIVEKVFLRTLAPKFDHIVVAIEESKKLEDLKVEELQGSLEAHEQRLLERSQERSTDQALQAQTSKKGKSWKYDQNRGKGKDVKSNSGKGSYQDQGKPQNSEQDKPESSRRGGFRNGRKKIDRKKLRCFNCQKIGHFSSECKATPVLDDQHEKRHKDEANMAKEDEDDEHPLLLMATTDQETCNSLMVPTDQEPYNSLMMNTDQVSCNSEKWKWYIDSGCSNHMTGHREWLINFDPRKKSSVRFADDRTITA